MQNDEMIQLTKIFNVAKPNAVLNEVYRIFTFYYPPKAFKLIKRCYILVSKLFDGSIPGYKRCNTYYHNFDHMLDVLLATVRLLDGNNLTKRKLLPDLVVNMVLAAIFHITGFIQEVSDMDGSGAKYTTSNIDRSIGFLKKNADELMIRDEDIETISKLMKFTDLNIKMEDIGVLKDDEKIAGKMLGSAHIIGQMSDRHYLEKLKYLFEEIKEAGISEYKDEYEFIKSRIDFFEEMKLRLSSDLDGLNTLSQFHFKQRYQIDRDLYMESIERNIEYLQKIVDDKNSDYKSKLKRVGYNRAMDKSSSADEPASSGFKIPV